MAAKRAFTNEEKKVALDLFSSFDGGRCKELVLEAGNDKNSEKGAGIQCFRAIAAHFLAVAALVWSEPEPPIWRRLQRSLDPAPAPAQT